MEERPNTDVVLKSGLHVNIMSLDAVCCECFLTHLLSVFFGCELCECCTECCTGEQRQADHTVQMLLRLLRCCCPLACFLYIQKKFLARWRSGNSVGLAIGDCGLNRNLSQSAQSQRRRVLPGKPLARKILVPL